MRLRVQSAFGFAAILWPVAHAFSGTVPLLAWSSRSSSSLDDFYTTVTESSKLVEQILLNDDVCALDAIILVSQQGLHASDLRTLTPSSSFAKAFYDAPSNRQFEYLASDPEAESLETVAEALAARCGARLVQFRPGADEGMFEGEHAKKNVVSINLPSLEGLRGAERKQMMRVHTHRLAEDLSVLSASLPNYLAIYTGSGGNDNSNLRRQSPTSPPVRPIFSETVYSPTATPSPIKGGILARYQLLTPGLITGLLLVLFVFLPILSLGFTALASIQSPLRTEAPKAFNASDKKRQ